MGTKHVPFHSLTVTYGLNTETQSLQQHPFFPNYNIEHINKHMNITLYCIENSLSWANKA